jgi:N-acetylglucosamine repressor
MSASQKHHATILRLLRDGKPRTRTNLAEEARLSLSTVSRVVESMIENRLLEENKSDEASIGRPAGRLRLNPELGFVVGLDIGAGTTRALVIDLLGRVLVSFAHKTKSYAGNEDFLQDMAALTKRAIRQAGLKQSQILGLGIGLSAIVDSDEGRCLFCPNIPGPNDVPVKEALAAEFPFEIFVDDQARTHALTEMRYGAAQGMDNFTLVTVGIGLGTAICMNGQIYRGENGLAGELGHITVKEDGPLCNCGNKGCLEALASGPAIVQRTRQALADGVYSSLNSLPPEELTVEAIAQAAQAGDKLAFFILDRTGQYLGIGIATALNILGSQLVIIGGGVARCGKILLEAIERTIKLRTLHVVSPRIRLARSTLDDQAAALGAALAVIDYIFSAPLEKSPFREMIVK